FATSASGRFASPPETGADSSVTLRASAPTSENRAVRSARSAASVPAASVPAASVPVSGSRSAASAPANLSTVYGSRAARSSSISTAVTLCPASSRPRVSEPSPGPISTTFAASSRPAAVTIERTVLGSMTKFCPFCFVGRRPMSAAISRMSRAVNNVTANNLQHCPPGTIIPRPALAALADDRVRPMDPQTLTDLLDVSVLDRLDRIDDLPGDELARSSALRKEGLSAEVTAALLTQARLRKEASAKLGPFADDMLFTRDGLAQATRLPVAAHHARRLIGQAA